MIKTTIIYENQRGLLFRNGKLKKILNPGLYRTWKFEFLCFRHRGEIEVIDILKPLHSRICDIRLLVNKNDALKNNTQTISVKKNNLQKVEFNGNTSFLSEGEYIVWNEFFKKGENIIDIGQTYISDPKILIGVPKIFFYEKEVNETSILYIDGIEQASELKIGKHYFWKNGTTVKISKKTQKRTTMLAKLKKLQKAVLKIYLKRSKLKFCSKHPKLKISSKHSKLFKRR